MNTFNVTFLVVWKVLPSRCGLDNNWPLRVGDYFQSPLLQMRKQVQEASWTCPRPPADRGQHQDPSPACPCPSMPVLAVARGVPARGFCAHTQQLHITGWRAWLLGCPLSHMGQSVQLGAATLDHCTGEVSVGRKVHRLQSRGGQ